MTAVTEHRLDGLEPDNLLAFLALLGLMRALEAARPDWCPRAGWTVDDPPVRPILRLRTAEASETVLSAVVDGLRGLVAHHDFGGARDLTFSVAEARDHLQHAVRTSRRDADLWASLVSDAALSSKGDKVEPTPLCLMFGQGHQHFLDRLATAPRLLTPPPRGDGRRTTAIS